MGRSSCGAETVRQIPVCRALFDNLNLQNANALIWCKGPEDAQEPSGETINTIIDKVADYLAPGRGLFQWTTYSKNRDITKVV